MTTAIHTITERAMTANLSMGMWQGYRLDKAASQRVTSQAGASADAARVNKHLIPKESLAPIVKAQGALRTHFYEHTLPWRDNGDRLMTRKVFLDFIPEHEKLKDEFDQAVEKFLKDEYPSAIEKAEFRMGTMFNRDDYPSVSELRHKFYVNLEIDAIATAGDFRVEMDQEHVDRVTKSMEEAATRRLSAATADIWKRLSDTVGYFHERMANPSAVFRDSTVQNILDLVELLPGLNVLDDPQIEEIRKDMVAKLTGVTPKELRQNSDVREEIADEAKAIMDKVSGFMAAFGAGDQ